MFSESLPIEAAAFKLRTYNCLRREGITTLGQLAERRELEVRRFVNLGPVCMADVKRVLTAHGLSLREERSK